MDQPALDPMLELFEAYRREIEHLQRTQQVNLKEELLLRVYPLIGKTIETLTDRMNGYRAWRGCRDRAGWSE